MVNTPGFCKRRSENRKHTFGNNKDVPLDFGPQIIPADNSHGNMFLHNHLFFK